MKIKEGKSLLSLLKFHGQLTLSIYAQYLEVLRLDVTIHVELNVEVQRIQPTVAIKLFCCFFLNEEAEDLLFLSSISLDHQSNKERVYTDNLQRSRTEFGSCSCNQSMALYIFENTKLTIGEKVELKIQAKANLINDSFTLENLRKGKQYLKINCLQFAFLIQVG